MAKRDLIIVVEITRNYGAHSVKFGLGEVVSINNGQERRDAYANLLVQLDDQIKLYEETILQDTRLTQPVVGQSENMNVLDKITVTNLLIESKNGKKEMSIQGGKYAKYGVPLYKDSCVTDLPLDEYEYGLHDLSHLQLTATIDIVDGKAKRVISIK